MFKNALIIMTFLLCIFVSHASAEENRTFDDWVVFPPTGGFYEAATTDDSGSQFGVICGEADCKFYLRLGPTCEKNTSYLALMNSDIGAKVFHLSCLPMAGHKGGMLVIEEDFKTLNDPFLKSFDIGFAVPMAGVQFKVVHFSMRGFLKAIELIGNLRTKDDSEKKKQGTRDSNL